MASFVASNEDTSTANKLCEKESQRDLTSIHALARLKMKMASGSCRRPTTLKHSTTYKRSTHHKPSASLYQQVLKRRHAEYAHKKADGKEELLVSYQESLLELDRKWRAKIFRVSDPRRKLPFLEFSSGTAIGLQ